MAVAIKRQFRDFSKMEVGDSQKFYDADCNSISKSAKTFCVKNNLTWRFTCSTEFDCIKITRIS